MLLDQSELSSYFLHYKVVIQKYNFFFKQHEWEHIMENAEHEKINVILFQ